MNSLSFSQILQNMVETSSQLITVPVVAAAAVVEVAVVDSIGKNSHVISAVIVHMCGNSCVIEYS